MKYKAVLFDLDGTLLNTLDDLADSMNAVLEKMGFPTHAVEAYKYFVGEGIVKHALHVLPEGHRDNETVLKCIASLYKEYSSRWDKKTKPYEGITELLDALTKLKIRMAVLTNRPDEFAKPVLDKLLPHWHFEAVMGANSTFPPKPDPGAALEIAKRLDLSPAEFLYVGDTDTDMKTAVAAGMYPIGITWGFRTTDELVSNGAKKILERPIDLISLL